MLLSDPTAAKKLLDEARAPLRDIPEDLAKPVDDKNNLSGYSNLVAVIKLLDAQRQQYRKEAQDNKDRADGLTSQLLAANKDIADYKEKIRTMGDEETKRRATLEAAHKNEADKAAAEIANLNQQIGQLKKQIDELNMKAMADKMKWDQEKAELQRESAELKEKLRKANQTPELAGTIAPLVANLPDGSISQVFPEMNLAYLRLTRPEQAKLGMRYVVYPKDKPVPASGQGKATLEVSSIEGGGHPNQDHQDHRRRPHRPRRAGAQPGRRAAEVFVRRVRPVRP